MKDNIFLFTVYTGSEDIKFIGEPEEYAKLIADLRGNSDSAGVEYAYLEKLQDKVYYNGMYEGKNPLRTNIPWITVYFTENEDIVLNFGDSTDNWVIDSEQDTITAFMMELLLYHGLATPCKNGFLVKGNLFKWSDGYFYYDCVSKVIPIPLEKQGGIA